MMEALDELDKALFIYINSHHSAFWDTIMVFVSEKLVWIPFYLALIGYIIYRYRKQSIPMLLAAVAAVGLADYIASGVFKPLFTRLRPCHDAELAAAINVVQGCGGQFGFMSSHAATTFALAVFFNLILSGRYRIFKMVLLYWALLISYSRIYLGVHFPGDIIGGAILGFVAAYVCALLYRYVLRRYPALQAQV